MFYCQENTINRITRLIFTDMKLFLKKASSLQHFSVCWQLCPYHLWTACKALSLACLISTSSRTLSLSTCSARPVVRVCAAETHMEHFSNTLIQQLGGVNNINIFPVRKQICFTIVFYKVCVVCFGFGRAFTSWMYSNWARFSAAWANASSTVLSNFAISTG